MAQVKKTSWIVFGVILVALTTGGTSCSSGNDPSIQNGTLSSISLDNNVLRGSINDWTRGTKVLQPIYYGNGGFTALGTGFILPNGTFEIQLVPPDTLALQTLEQSLNYGPPGLPVVCDYNVDSVTAGVWVTRGDIEFLEVLDSNLTRIGRLHRSRNPRFEDQAPGHFTTVLRYSTAAGIARLDRMCLDYSEPTRPDTSFRRFQMSFRRGWNLRVHEHIRSEPAYHESRVMCEEPVGGSWYYREDEAL